MNDSLPVYIEKYLKKFSLNNWQLELNNEGEISTDHCCSRFGRIQGNN